MTLSSPKGHSALAAFPHTLSSIAITVGGLAMFLVFASWVLVSFPVGATVRGYFYSVDSSKRVELLNPTVIQAKENSSVVNEAVNLVDNIPSSKLVSDDNETPNDESVIQTKVSGSMDNNIVNMVENSPPTKVVSHDSVTSNDESVASEKEGKEAPSTASSVVFSKSPQELDARNATANAVESVEESKPPLSVLPKNFHDPQKEAASDCDLYQGTWFYDPLGPIYTNNSCPVLTQMQNCQGNGRPDREYENWRWKPSGCDFPRFNAKKFLELMKGKTLAFIGDSVARNQMESLMCLLWQVEVPKNRGNKRMQRWYFRSNSVMIVRIWSSWLVHHTSEPLDFAPEGVVKLHLDLPDRDLMEFIPNFDVVVLSSGHWFAKQSVYVLDNKIVGGQLWWPDKSRHMKVNNVEAFGISVETIFSAIASHPNYTGLIILRSYSPDHYEGGAWNTGGSCTGKVHPLAPGQLVENGFTNVMHEKQVTGFKRALKKATNKSKLVLMDITKVFGYRHDGHPGPYRSPDPNKITKRGPDGRPPPQDCLHWCMPGPVDTWNELVLEIIRREFHG